MRKSPYIAAVVIASTLMLHSGAAKAERCSDRQQKMKSVEDKWDEVAWGELNTEEYATLLLALASSQPSGFVAFLGVLRDALGDMVDSLVQQVGEEGAVKLLAEVLQTGNTLKFENVEVGRQFWINQECLPSCANPALFCIPLPPSTALYVAWNYEETPRM